MTAASPASKVVIQNAVDESVYFVDGVTWESVWVPNTPEDQDRPERIVFAVFTPSNGYDKGREHRVPIERVISIVTDA